MRILSLLSIVCVLCACEKPTPQKEESVSTPPSETVVKKNTGNKTALQAILAKQPEEHKARYQYRNPKETLTFFGISPGMTVVEILPGNGWYSQIIVPLLGNEGTLIGADYNMALWPNFEWMNEGFLDGRKAWPAEWSGNFTKWGGDTPATPVATTISNIPAQYSEQVDAVLFIRALHNLARFESKGQFLTEALKQTHAVLKPGGVVGIVQHQASEDKPNDWADGSRGYLKKSFVKMTMLQAGFEFVGESSINENALDQPSEEDIVWRLPPSYFTTGEDEVKKAAMDEIGESNRMTLLFKKPDA